jgi:hypothetical protein
MLAAIDGKKRKVDLAIAYGGDGLSSWLAIHVFYIKINDHHIGMHDQS